MRTAPLLRLSLIALSLLPAACRSDLTLEEPSENREGDDVSVDDVGARPSPGGIAKGDPSDLSSTVLRCDGDREFRVSVTASRLEGLDGAAVWLSAVQRPDDGGDAEVVVLLSGSVSDGAFHLACERGLSTTYAYPSLAAAVDSDRSGGCSTDDQVFFMQLYGWNDAQDYVLDGSIMVAPYAADNAWSRMGEISPTWDEDPCAYHFPGL